MRWLVAFAKAAAMTLVLVVSAPAARNIQCETFNGTGTALPEETIYGGTGYSLNRTLNTRYSLRCAECAAVGKRKQSGISKRISLSLRPAKCAASCDCGIKRRGWMMQPNFGFFEIAYTYYVVFVNRIVLAISVLSAICSYFQRWTHLDFTTRAPSHPEGE